ncbi:glycosyltransferase [Exiguobacterium sp. s193]|uniref:glycosyltransferase n=1 Tax=Exiguobacterium sp. s193 TaxID=2751207 RepID=UPI001BE8BDCB|nr:glycosyltransferase [Exiguobacterium sp. s193]
MFFLINSLRGNGAERVLITLLHQIPFNYKITLFLLKNEVDLKIPSNVRIISLEPKRFKKYKIISLIYSSYKLSKIIRKKKIVVHSYLFKASLVNVIVKLLGSKHKIVIHEHSVPSNNINGNFFLKVLYKIMYLNSSRIVAVSNGVKDEILNILKDDKNEKIVKLIYNPINIQEIEDKSKQTTKIIEGTPYVIAVGRLEKVKQFDLLIQNFPIDANYNMYILGKGPEKEKLKKQIEDRNLEKKIKILDWTPNPYPLIKKSKVLVVTSLFESFSMVILESICCKTPVVSFNCKYGPEEILNDSPYGIVVKKNDWKDFFVKVEQKIEEDNNWNDKEVRSFLDGYDIKNVLEKYNEVFNYKYFN